MPSLANEIQFDKENQSFWQTGLILSSGFGLVSTMVGGLVSKQYGAGTAVTSILLGNFILWFIGLGIITMTSKRAHAIQNIKENLGNFAAAVAAIVIVAAFLVWYALQIKTPTELLTKLVEKNNSAVGDNFELRISAALGFTCALVGMGGIRTIKWINIFSFPVLMIFLIYLVYKSDTLVSFEGSWGFSFAGILSIALTWFPGTVNLSTFFRHSRSQADSFLGLTIMTISHIFFQLCAVLADINSMLDFISTKFFDDSMLLFATTGFVVLSFFCVNLLNIYWASIGWEVFFKDKQESKGYAIIGLLGTVIYVFFQSSVIIAFIEALGTAFIVNLGVTLIASYIIKFVVQHRVRRADKLSNAVCWFAGCSTAIIQLSFDPSNMSNAVLIGINTCLVTFGIIIFLEEILWSVKHLSNK
jgi:hypothetical protein